MEGPGSLHDGLLEKPQASPFRRGLFKWFCTVHVSGQRPSRTVTVNYRCLFPARPLLKGFLCVLTVFYISLNKTLFTISESWSSGIPCCMCRALPSLSSCPPHFLAPRLPSQGLKTQLCFPGAALLQHPAGPIAVGPPSWLRWAPRYLVPTSPSQGGLCHPAQRTGRGGSTRAEPPNGGGTRCGYLGSPRLLQLGI